MDDMRTCYECGKEFPKENIVFGDGTVTKLFCSDKCKADYDDKYPSTVDPTDCIG